MNILQPANGITLREAQLEDAEKIYNALASNRAYFQVWLPFAATLKSVKDEEEFLNAVLAVPYETREIVYIIEEGEKICGLVGYCFSDLDNHRTEIGYWLLPEYQRRGIMTDCVRYLCRWAIENRTVNRIQIRCAAGNKPSNAIPLRLGFLLEGTEREGQLLASGQYTDIHVYSILKREVEKWGDSSTMEQQPQLNDHNKQEYPPMHTAEHIVNRTMVNLYDCGRALSAHIERKKSKLDFALPHALSDDDITRIEEKVNEVISMKLPVTVAYISQEAAGAQFDLKRLPENASETIRIVNVGEYDSCPCIGTHVENTSEIGTFKIISHDYKEGVVRIRFKLS